MRPIHELLILTGLFGVFLFLLAGCDANPRTARAASAAAAEGQTAVSQDIIVEFEAAYRERDLDTVLGWVDTTGATNREETLSSFRGAFSGLFDSRVYEVRVTPPDPLQKTEYEQRGVAYRLNHAPTASLQIEYSHVAGTPRNTLSFPLAQKDGRWVIPIGVPAR